MNKGGKSFPFGIFAPSALSLSKKGWTMASTALNHASGVYSSSFKTRSIASGDVRGRKTYNQGGGGVIGVSLKRTVSAVCDEKNERRDCKSEGGKGGNLRRSSGR